MGQGPDGMARQDTVHFRQERGSDRENFSYNRRNKIKITTYLATQSLTRPTGLSPMTRMEKRGVFLLSFFDEDNNGWSPVA